MVERPNEAFRVGIGAQDDRVRDLLIEALSPDPDIQITCLDARDMDDFLRSQRLEAVVLCDRTLLKIKEFLMRRKQHAGRSMPIYLAIRKNKLKDHSEILNLVDGCILLDEGLNILPGVVRIAKYGYAIMPEALTNIFIDIGKEQEMISHLDLYECTLLQELCYTGSEKEIARRLGTTQVAIKKCLRLIYNKINVTLRGEAVSFAQRHKEDLHNRRRELIREGVSTC